MLSSTLADTPYRLDTKGSESESAMGEETSRVGQTAWGYLVHQDPEHCATEVSIPSSNGKFHELWPRASKLVGTHREMQASCQFGIECFDDRP